MVSTEIHLSVSLNPQFINMLRFFVRSVALNACITGPWKIVVTVSRDTEMTLDAPELAWARDYPVEFRWVEQTLWQQHGLLATALQTASYEFSADVILCMDADMVVCGSLDDLIAEVAQADVIAGWPAWQPPSGIDLDEILACRGCSPDRDYGLTYSGYGLEFLSPRKAPPYFNVGLIATSQRQAEIMRVAYPQDLFWFLERASNWFCCQIALCLTIVRQNLRYRALDMRYNLSNGDWDERPTFVGEDVDRAVANLKASVADARIIHYCVRTPAFAKEHQMENLDRIREFCAREDIGAGDRMLQRVLRQVL